MLKLFQILFLSVFFTTLFQTPIHFSPFLSSAHADDSDLTSALEEDNYDLEHNLPWIGKEKKLFKVHQIQVQGNKKIEKEAILDRISHKPGSWVTNLTVRRDIHELYNMKFFDHIKVSHKKSAGKNILVYHIIERPIISKIVIEGNDELSKDDLKKILKTKEYSIINVNLVQEDVRALEKHYEEKGYYLASVRHRIVKQTEEDTVVYFDIKENDKVKVKRIDILGNQAFSDDELKSILETREDSLFGAMSGAGSFKEFSFQTDIERIKYFYKTKGYLQINVGFPTITVSEDKKWIYVVLKVNEGPQYAINDITFKGDVFFSDGELEDEMLLKRDQIYSEDSLRKDIQMLTQKYQDLGYAYANVIRTLKIVPGENKVDVHFLFEKGQISYFGRISIKGNTKTRDKVIRRELRIEEGMKFSGTKLRESKENVIRLGFFEPQTVIFHTSPSKKDSKYLDVEVSVKERNTGQITFGAGYSTAQGGFLQSSVSQNNFLGKGQSLSFTLSLAKKNQEYRLGFLEPYLWDTSWTAGGDIFSTKNEMSSSYQSKKKGFDLRVGHPVFDYSRVYLVYKFIETKLNRVSDDSIDTNLENGIASSVESSIVYDKRNNKFEPTSGRYGSFSVEYAGLGGDQYWTQVKADGRLYYTIIDDLVFRTRLSAKRMFAVDGKPIPRSQKYHLGGARNMRGYDYEDIGPLRFITETTSSGQTYQRKINLGGLFSIFTNLELEYPLVREAGLKWVVFYDMGNVYREYMGKDNDFSLRANYGFGFRWFAPIGVLRFEFGYPIHKREHEDGRQFHFDIGQIF